MKQWPLRAWQIVVYSGFALVVLLEGHLDSFASNGTALAKGIGLALVAVLGFVATRRMIRQAWTREVVRLVPLVAIAAVTLLPALRDKRVDDAIPVAVAVPTTAAAPAAAPVSVATVRIGGGAIAGIGHRASGGAAIYRLADGAHVVRLEDFSVENGPDYRVYLVPGPGRRSPSGGTELGALKGSSGNQNYEVPTSVAIDGPHTVLVWCRAFSVPVAAATIG